MTELMELLRGQMHIVIALIVAGAILYAMDRHHRDKADDQTRRDRITST